MGDVKKSIEAAVAYLSMHPEEAQYADSQATATLELGLRCRVTGPKGESVVTDMPSAAGGDEVGVSPGWLFRAALASCDASLVAMEAAKEAVSLEHLEVTVDSISDDRGILAMDQSTPAGPLLIRVRIRLRGNASPERLEEIVRNAVAHCPVHEGAGRAVPIELALELDRRS
jgi:uncharacterized OsmC-like protein